MAPQAFVNREEDALKNVDTFKTLTAVKQGYTKAEQNAFAVMNTASKTFDKVLLA